MKKEKEDVVFKPLEKTPYEEATETASKCEVGWHPIHAHMHAGESGYFKK